MSRWDAAGESYLSRVSEPDTIWVEYLTLDPMHPYETLLCVILEDLPDSIIIALPSNPLVEVTSLPRDDEPDRMVAIAEVAQISPVMRLYKSNILYSNQPPKELKLAYYKLLKAQCEDILTLPEMLRKSPAHPNYELTDEQTFAVIEEEISKLEIQCKIQPEVFDNEGRARILEAAGIHPQEDEEEVPDDGTIIH